MEQRTSCIFVGGPGRSGTTLVAHGLAQHPAVCSFYDVELKVFCETNGLIDLRGTLTDQYSPTRALTAIRQFREVVDALIEGGYGQSPLALYGRPSRWRGMTDRFLGKLLVDDFPVRATAEEFDKAVHGLVADLARAASSNKPGSTTFLEKTPGNLLFADTIERFAPGSRYVHVMRDPRAIASSLLRISWGPDSIEACARWVSNYGRAWQATKERLAAAGIDFLELYLEEIVEAPDREGGRATKFLGLSSVAGLFDDASPTPMDRPIYEVPREHLGYLTAALEESLASSGYAPEAVGKRQRAEP